jgi:hypothetical protein
MHNNLKKLLFYVSLFFISFVGGSLTVVFWYNFSEFSIKIQSTDAISIANTYIVFTTIIFVGFSVFLAIAGFIFTQQFSTSKEDQFTHLLREIGDKLKENENDFGIKFINKSFENPDVKNYVHDKLNKKLNQLIQDKANNLNNEQMIMKGLSVSSQGA